jgi:uncharacterized protein DUF4124
MFSSKRSIDPSVFFAGRPLSRRKSAILFCTAVWFGLTACGIHQASASDVIYRSTGPKGEVTYGSLPAPDAVRTETIKVETLSPEQRRATEQLLLRQEQEARGADAYVRAQEEKWQRVDREIMEAQIELQKAEAALEDGRTPLAGERLGLQTGRRHTQLTRLTEAYFDRILELEAAVDKARQRLDNAYEARRNLR